jgi:hypothetical protein
MRPQFYWTNVPVAALSADGQSERMLKAGRIAALGAGALLAAAGTAWAALTPEGPAYPTGTDPYSLNVADFNGDGRPDVATINGTSGNVSVFLRQAGGGFAQEAGSPVTLDGGPSNAAVADVNGDGLPDLAVGLFVGNLGVDLLVRNAGGGFTKQSVDTSGGVSAIAAADFNGDHRPDLAIARQSAGTVSILLNQGGTFTPGQTLTTDASPGPIAVGDFNGDTIPDLAVLSTTGNDAFIALGAGNGQFTRETSVATGVRPGGILAADFNGDGRSDLAVSNYTDGTVSVLDSTGTGFVPEPGSPIAVTTGPVGLALAGADIAVAANGGAVDVLTRNASGGFTREPPVALAGFQNGIGAADFDGDGRPDLAVSQISAGTTTPSSFSVLLNPAPAQPTPTPTPTATPVAGKTVVAARRSGTVRFRKPGARTFVTLTGAAPVPVGSTIDTRKGRVALTAAQGRGRTASADFFAGLFKLTQTKGAKPATTLALTERLSCPRRGKASAAAKRPKSRRLWGSGHGRFTTKGSYSAATVRGTKWLVQDTCTTTLTKVTSGVVSVRDFAKRRTTLVRAGHRYLARRRR